MHWMNPAGAWALAALAVILCLYILKQKMEPLTISSTHLWQKALSSMEADRPFQKLRRNLLLFLQLLLALLLALSLMRPMTLGGEAGEVVFVFDLSASMQAEDGGGSRLDAAVSDAKRRVDGLPDGAKVSVITAGAQVSQPLARSSDPMAARRALESLTPENGGADLDGALSLAYALRRELEDVDLIVYTDQQLPEGNAAIQPSIGTGLANRAVLSVSATDTAAVARVANHGDDAEVTVECTADGLLVDIRAVSLPAGETVSVHFDLPAPAATVEARIVEEDALAADNRRAWVRRETGGTTVVFAGRDNVFVETALALRPDITVLKTTREEASVVQGGALTVLDGPLPEVLPEQGALLLIDPDARVGEAVETHASLTAASGALADQLNQYLTVEEIQVSRYKPVVSGAPIWMIAGAPVLTLTQEHGRQEAVLGFDLHDSNLPLLKEFPLFMQSLLSHLVPEPLGAGFEDGECGSQVPIQPYSLARSAQVITPSGRGVPIDVTGGTLGDTNEIGVYTLVQTDASGSESALPFTLHIPAGESDVRAVGVSTNETEQTGRGAAYGREWTPWLIGLLLAVALLEWWVYRRGY